MKKLFGTDGVRGKAGDPPLDVPTVRRLGAALVRVLRHDELTGVLAHELSHHLGLHTVALTVQHWLTVPAMLLARIGFFLQNVAQAAAASAHAGTDRHDRSWRAGAIGRQIGSLSGTSHASRSWRTLFRPRISRRHVWHDSRCASISARSAGSHSS